MKAQKDRIEALEKEIAQNKPMLEACENAIEILEKLTKEKSTQSALSMFVDAHSKNIVSIFKRIHAPREFADVVFSENSVLLKRISGKDAVELTKISTGQRAALALSIFLSLNSSASKAPSLILIDDPISYIDDLNILSFLDFLKDLVIYSDKQIVFATANNKLANLFRKKFSFLGDEFVEHSLKR